MPSVWIGLAPSNVPCTSKPVWQFQAVFDQTASALDSQDVAVTLYDCNAPDAHGAPFQWPWPDRHTGFLVQINQNRWVDFKRHCRRIRQALNGQGHTCTWPWVSPELWQALLASDTAEALLELTGPIQAFAFAAEPTRVIQGHEQWQLSGPEAPNALVLSAHTQAALQRFAQEAQVHRLLQWASRFQDSPDHSALAKAWVASCHAAGVHGVYEQTLAWVCFLWLAASSAMNKPGLPDPTRLHSLITQALECGVPVLWLKNIHTQCARLRDARQVWISESPVDDLLATIQAQKVSLKTPEIGMQDVVCLPCGDADLLADIRRQCLPQNADSEPADPFKTASKLCFLNGPPVCVAGRGQLVDLLLAHAERIAVPVSLDVKKNPVQDFAFLGTVNQSAVVQSFLFYDARRTRFQARLNNPDSAALIQGSVQRLTWIETQTPFALKPPAENATQQTEAGFLSAVATPFSRPHLQGDFSVQWSWIQAQAQEVMQALSWRIQADGLLQLMQCPLPGHVHGMYRSQAMQFDLHVDTPLSLVLDHVANCSIESFPFEKPVLQASVAVPVKGKLHAAQGVGAHTVSLTNDVLGSLTVDLKVNLSTKGNRLNIQLSCVLSPLVASLQIHSPVTGFRRTELCLSDSCCLSQWELVDG